MGWLILASTSCDWPKFTLGASLPSLFRAGRQSATRRVIAGCLPALGSFEADVSYRIGPHAMLLLIVGLTQIRNKGDTSNRG